jgi:cytosine/adenosine deaminase-related metal-dependent hydrolase
MVTINGARALGLTGQIGELAENSLADLIAVPDRTGTGEAAEAVLAHTGAVIASMIDGQWAMPPE